MRPERLGRAFHGNRRAGGALIRRRRAGHGRDEEFSGGWVRERCRDPGRDAGHGSAAPLAPGPRQSKDQPDHRFAGGQGSVGQARRPSSAPQSEAGPKDHFNASTAGPMAPAAKAQPFVSPANTALRNAASGSPSRTARRRWFRSRCSGWLGQKGAPSARSGYSPPISPPPRARSNP